MNRTVVVFVERTASDCTLPAATARVEIPTAQRVHRPGVISVPFLSDEPLEHPAAGADYDTR
jgi:hypothetical protein